MSKPINNNNNQEINNNNNHEKINASVYFYFNSNTIS